MSAMMVSAFFSFIGFLIWLNFMHQVLHPKYDHYKSEKIILCIWMVWLISTATVLYLMWYLKIGLYIFFIFFSVCFFYEDSLSKKISVSLFLVSLEMFVEIVLLSILFLFRSFTEFETIQYMIGSSLTVLAHAFACNKAIRYFKNGSLLLRKRTNLVLFLMFVQLNMEVVFFFSIMYFNNDYILYECIYLILLNICFYLYYKKTAQQLLAGYREEIYHNQLTKLYEKQLEELLFMKDKDELTRHIRHDLLNEIEVMKRIKVSGS